MQSLKYCESMRNKRFVKHKETALFNKPAVQERKVYGYAVCLNEKTYINELVALLAILKLNFCLF